MLALKSLTSDNLIIIKEPDKGGAIVVINKMDYHNEVTQQLSDYSYYTPIWEDPTRHIQNLNIIVVNEAWTMGHIDDNIANF